MRIALLVLVALLMIQLVLPPIIEGRLAQAIGEELQAQEIAVRIRAFPAIALLWGRLQGLEIRARDLRLPGLSMESLRIQAQSIEFSPQVILGGELSWQAQWSQVEAKVNQSQLNEAFRQELGELVRWFHLELGDDRVWIVGEIPFWDLPPLRVGGELIPREGELVFAARHVQVDLANWPGWIADLVLEIIGFQLALPALPLQIDSTEVREGSLVLLGRLD